MKKIIIVIALCFSFVLVAQHKVTRTTVFTKELRVGDSASYDSSIFTVNTTEKGILIPRMTTSQKNAINNPKIGLLVFDKTEKKFYYYDGSIWVSVMNSSPKENDVRSVVTGSTSTIEIYKGNTWKSIGMSFTLN